MKTFYLMMSYRVMSPNGITYGIGDSLNKVDVGLPKGKGEHDYIDLDVIKEDIIKHTKLRETFGDDVRIIFTSLSELSEDCFLMLSGKLNKDGKEKA